MRLSLPGVAIAGLLLFVAMGHATTLVQAGNTPGSQATCSAGPSTDPATAPIPPAAQPTTVQAILSGSDPASKRASAAGIMTAGTVVRLNVLLVSARLGINGDIRLLLADPDDAMGATTLAAEIPNPTGCEALLDSGAVVGTQQAREAFTSALGVPPSDSEEPLWRYAAITAVVPPNIQSQQAGSSGGVELRPLLSFQLVALATPLTAGALDEAANIYRTYVASGLDELATDTDALQFAIDGGQIDQARKLWLTAHLDYARLGAAYGTFGDFDAKINGRSDGLVEGVDDPDFTGFLSLEHGLWGGASAAQLQPVADRLNLDVHALVAAFPYEDMDPRDLPLRAHEILENALQFELTGQTDDGSHTNLATVQANVDGTQIVLQALRPLLAPRAPRVFQTVSDGVNALAGQLATYQQFDGNWVPLNQLTRMQRERLDGSLGQLLEELAPIPDVLELPPGSP